MEMTLGNAARGAALAALLALAPAASGTAAAKEEGPLTLKEGSWVCGTLELYRRARDNDWDAPRFSMAKFRAGTQENEACIFIDDDLLEDMMAPFVVVGGKDGGEVRVSFIVEFYKRIEMLHRRFSRITITGWTDAANVETRIP